MSKIYLYLLLFIASCTSKRNNEQVCNSSLFQDSLLVTRNAKSTIKIENLKNNQGLLATFFSDSEYCIEPILDKEHIYYNKNNYELICVDFFNNKLTWSYNCENLIKSYKLFDGIVIIDVLNEGLILLDANTGDLKFNINNVGSSTCHSMIVHDYKLKNNTLLVSDFLCKNIISYSLSNFNKIWSYKSIFSGATNFVNIDEKIFCGITGNPIKGEGEIVVLNNLSGRVEFKKKEKVDLIVKPIKYNNNIIFYTYDSNIKSFNLKTFELKTLVNLEDVSLCGSQLVLFNDNLFFYDCNYKIFRYNLSNLELIDTNKQGSFSIVYDHMDEIKFR